MIETRDMRPWEKFKAKMRVKKDRASRRQRNVRFLKKMGQLTSMPNGYWAEKHFEILKALVRLLAHKFVDPRVPNVPAGICRICGKNPVSCAYHLVPCNEGSAAKYDFQNIVGACDNCNKGEVMFRRKYVDKHKRIFGAVWYENLVARLKISVKYSAADHKEKYLHYKKIMEAVLGGKYVDHSGLDGFRSAQ